jgi:hypothetical protein
MARPVEMDEAFLLETGREGGGSPLEGFLVLVGGPFREFQEIADVMGHMGVLPFVDV